MRISDWSSDVCSSDLMLTEAATFSPMVGASLAEPAPAGNGRGDVGRHNPGGLYAYRRRNTLVLAPAPGIPMFPAGNADARAYGPRGYATTESVLFGLVGLIPGAPRGSCR